MNVVEMHPEDLLDKEELTEAERARLDAHLERCATCRYDMQLRADFLDEMEGEERTHFDSQEIIALVEGSPTKIERVEEVEEPEPPRPPDQDARVAGLPRRRFRMKAWMFAAAALLLVGGAAAGPAKSRQLISDFVLGETRETRELPWSGAPSPAAPPATIEIVHTAAPVVPVDTAPVPSAPTNIDPVSFETSARPSANVERAPVTTPAAPAESAHAMFDAANDARRQGDYARAIELYRQLQAKFPSSRESHVSMGSVGRLQLDRGDAMGALSSFDSYQARGHGDLDESVMVGRATAFERLGRNGDAKRAWQSLLDTYPSTPYAEHAKIRAQESRDSLR